MLYQYHSAQLNKQSKTIHNQMELKQCTKLLNFIVYYNNCYNFIFKSSGYFVEQLR